MKIINLFLIALCTVVVLSEDQGDWVDPYKLPLNFTAHPFFAGYLPIGSQRENYYVYHPS
jgi:hypothetical protein